MTNDLLREQVLEIVNNQIEANEPKETKEVFTKLIEKGLSYNESIELIGQCVAFEIFNATKSGKGYNSERYIKKLKSLY